MKIQQQWYARGFQVGHQKVFVDVNFGSQTLEGWTELSIIPLSADLDSAALHCWQSEITNCEVEGQGALWQHIDGLPALRLSDDSATVHQHDGLRNKFSSLNRTIDKCDLHIKFPEDVKVVIQERDSGQTTHNMGTSGANENGNEEEIDVATPAVMPTPMTPRGNFPADHGQVQYKPIFVKIWFRCRPVLGARFFKSGTPSQYPLFYTTNHPIPCSTSLWCPCLDGIWERSTWEMSISIPKTIGCVARRQGQDSQDDDPIVARVPDPNDRDGEQDPDLPDSTDAMSMTVVCSADFVDEQADREDPSRKIVTFAQSSPVGAGHMAFAVGPFQHLNLSELREVEEDDLMGSSVVDVHLYSTPDKFQDAKNTCYPLYKAMDYFVREYGSFPFSSYQMVFLDDMEVDSVAAAGLGMFSERLLYGERLVEPIYPVTKALVVELASQWVGVNIVPRSWSDTWLILGIAHYISGLFLRKLMGNNDYRFRLKQDVIRITQEDIGKPPISSRCLEVPIDPSQTRFIALKAPVVLHMLDQRLMKAGTTLGLARVIPRIFLQALSGELPNGILSTEKFLKQCERLAHIKLEDFAKQWIFGHGYPRFSVVQRFNKKKMVIEMGIRQQQFQDDSRAPVTETNFVDDGYRAMTRVPEGPVEAVFTGSLTIRIHEADGTPYEHVVELKEQYHKVDIPYNNKYRKRVRSRKAAKSKLNGDSIGDNTISGEDVEDETSLDQIQCLGDGYQTEADRETWHLAEWSAEDEDKMSSESFEWIRVDSGFEWICTMQVGQPDYMYHSQLQQDRDVVAQLEAVQYFSSIKPSPVIATVLFRTIMDERYYYGIRQAAAQALTKAAIEEEDYLGQKQLVAVYRSMYCFQDTEKVIPKANDFSDIANYLLRKSILEAFVSIRSRGYTSSSLRALLLDQLIYNDNSENIYDDTFFISLLIDCLISSLIHSDPLNAPNFHRERQLKLDLDKILLEVEKFQRMDRWRPSYTNLISRTIVAGKERLMQAGLLPTSFKEFMSYTREEHFVLLRHQAFSAMLNLGGLRSEPLCRYLMFVQAQDPSAYTKHQFSILLKEGIGAMALRGKRSKYDTHNEVETMIIEEDTTAAVELRKDRESRSTLEGALSVFRDEFKDDEVLKEHLWKVANDWHAALLIRRNILDICKIMYETKEISILKFKLPSMKARLQCFSQGPGKVVIKKTRPLEKYQKKAPVKPIKIKLKIFNSGSHKREESDGSI